MNRKQKLVLNSLSSLFYQIVAVICGFILPRMFLKYYGSDVNGLISSISHFLGFITIGDLGVGAVVQSTLYKPLSSNNVEEISRIYLSSVRFFRKISLILVFYMGALSVIYPLIVIEKFSFIYTFILIIAISISSYAQYFFCISYRLILNADQLGFYWMLVHSISLILNTLLCVILMNHCFTIQVVKLVTSLIFICQPIAIVIIVRKRYKLNLKTRIVGEPIKQKWNGLAQHIATVVLNNTDTVVLTLFSTLSNVSIYSVYYLVVNGVKQLIVSSTNGIQALLGNMLAKKEFQRLNNIFSSFEWLLHTITTLIFSCTAILIVPFVSIYTKNINDANYILPTFGLLITLAQASYCLRMPYNLMILAAGHYKQTQTSAIIEAIINILVSCILVYNLGLVGVAIGTLIAMLYRTIYLAYYLSKNILLRKISYLFHHLLVDSLSVFIIILSSRVIFGKQYLLIKYSDWIIHAICTFSLSIILILIINIFFYKNEILHLKDLVLKRHSTITFK